MIVVSAAEFANTVIKACLGAGVERGVSEEVGPACMELSLRNLPSLEPLIKQLEREAGKPQSEQAHWVRGNKGWKTERITSLDAAVSMIDFASISGNDGARAEMTAVPHICIGTALSNARYTKRRLEVSLADEDWFDAESDLDRLHMLPVDQPMAIRFRHESAGDAKVGISAIEVPKQVWHSLDIWTSNTLVSADESSRADAGAGNTDND